MAALAKSVLLEIFYKNVATNKFARIVGISLVSEIDKEDKILIERRSGCTLSDTDTVCYHHFEYFCKKFPQCQKYCCNPFGKHRSDKNPLGNNVISIELADQFVNCIIIWAKYYPWLEVMSKMPQTSH